MSVGAYPREWWRPLGATPPVTSGSRVVFWLLMGFTFILLLSPQAWVPMLEPLRIALVAGALAIGMHLFVQLVHRRPITILTREIWLALGILAWAILTIPFSYYPRGSVDALLGWYLKSLAIFWLLANIAVTAQRLRQIAWGLSVMSVPIALTAVNHFFIGKYLESTRMNARILGYEAPLTGNPNDLALMLNLMLSLSIGLLMSSRSVAARLFLIGAALLDVLAVIFTFSRGGFLTMAVVLAIFLRRLFERRKRAVILVMLSVSVLLLVFLLPGYWDRLTTITDIESDPTGSAEARWSDIIAATHFVLWHPIIGAGLGMDVLALNEARGPLWTSVHNVYLQIAVDLGLPGILLFLLLLFGCLNIARRVRERTRGKPGLGELHAMAEGIHVSLIAFAVAAFFHPVSYNFYFYYIAGLAVALKQAHEARPGPVQTQE